MAIGRSIASLFVRMGLDPSGLKSGATQARAEVASLKADLAGGAAAAGGLQNALGLLGSAGLLYGAKQVASFAWELGKVGAQSLQVEAALRDLTRGTGTSMNELVASVREAAGGTVSEFETMLALNRGNLLGMGTDVQQWADLMEVARFKARAMGIDTTQALGDITTGIGRESRLILDNLGIILDTEAVTAQWAATLGKATDQLTAAERKQALMNAVIIEGKAQIAAAGGMTDSYADQIAAAEAAMADLAMTMKESLAPAMAEVAVLAKEMANSMGPALGDAVEGMAEDVSTLHNHVILLTDALRAGFMADAAIEIEGAAASMDVLAEAARQAKLELLATFVGLPEDTLDRFARVSGDELLELGIAAGKTFDEIQAAAEKLGKDLPVDAWARWATAINASADEGQRWRMIMDGAGLAVEQVGTAAEIASGSIGSLTGTFATGKPAALAYAESLYAVNEAIGAYTRAAATVSAADVGRGSRRAWAGWRASC